MSAAADWKKKEKIMGTLKRFTSSIMANFNAVITQLENHEALINTAIRDVQEAAGRAKAQLKRVHEDGIQMRRRLGDLREQSETWEERARKVAKDDEKKALECVRRRKRCIQEIASLEEDERQHANVERQLNQDLSLLTERINKLKTQRNMMRTRESRAQALGSMQQESTSLMGEIDDIFDRWESKVNEYEIQGGCALHNQDAFEEEFVTAEEEDELKGELAALLSSST